jgi:hypothetical protein
MALGGCTGASVYGFHASTQYSPGHVAYAQADGPTQAVIRGNPFRDDTDGAIVLGHMQRRNFRQPLSFSQAARPESTHGYKVVMVFGHVVDPRANACATTTPAFSPAQAGRTEITAAFCARDYTLTQVVGAMAGPSSARDPALRGLIGDVMNALLPPEDPFRRDQRDDFGRFCIPPAC